MKQPKIYYVQWVVPSYRAITIPPIGIFVKKKCESDQKLLKHEIIHWKQYKRMGLPKFYINYFKQFLIYGYKNMPMEIEARKLS